MDLVVVEVGRVVIAEANPNLVTLDPKGRSPSRETLDTTDPKKEDHLGLGLGPRTKELNWDVYGMVLGVMMTAIPR